MKFLNALGLRLGAAGSQRAGADEPSVTRDDEGPGRDAKRLFLVIGLGALSWVATYVGMLELIESNLGDLPFIHKIIIGFSVSFTVTVNVHVLKFPLPSAAVAVTVVTPFGKVAPEAGS